MDEDNIKMPHGYTAPIVLGEGAYGKVMMCFKHETKEVVAIKFSKYVHALKKEEKTMKKLMRHRMDKYNIIKFHGSPFCRGWKCLVLELLEMDLHDYIWSSKQPMPLRDVRSVIQQMAEAFNALKRLGVIHCDVKPDNIMVVNRKEKPLRVKLIDFGVAIHRSKASQGMIVEVIPFRAPEILLGLPFSEAIDIWSLGCVMGMMFLQQLLIPAENRYDALRFISDLVGPAPKYLVKAGRYSKRYFNETFSKRMILKTPEEFWERADNLPTDERRDIVTLDKLKQLIYDVQWRECIDLLTEMLRWDGRLRITPHGILKHPFITMTYLDRISDEPPASANPSTSTSTSCAQTPTDGDLDDSCPSPEDSDFIRTSPVCSPLVSDHKKKKKNCFKRFWSWVKKKVRPQHWNEEY